MRAADSLFSKWILLSVIALGGAILPSSLANARPSPVALTAAPTTKGANLQKTLALISYKLCNELVDTHLAIVEIEAKQEEAKIRLRQVLINALLKEDGSVVSFSELSEHLKRGSSLQNAGLSISRELLDSIQSVRHNQAELQALTRKRKILGRALVKLVSYYADYFQLPITHVWKIHLQYLSKLLDERMQMDDNDVFEKSEDDAEAEAASASMKDLQANNDLAEMEIDPEEMMLTNQTAVSADAANSYLLAVPFKVSPNGFKSAL